MRVAVLGLGHMGRPIADRLLDAGHEVAVWNRAAAVADPFRDRGARVLSSPAEAWDHGDVAITMLANDAAAEAVLSGPDGLFCAGDDGRTVVEMSTISPTSSAALAAQAESVQVTFVRAPVTGNPSVVVAGNLGIIVSGPSEAYERLESLLRDVGPNHFVVGEADEARVVKLALNLVIGGTSQLIAEALVMAEANGIDRAEMLHVMGGSAIGSPFVKYKTEALIADDYESTFTAVGLHKDLALALATANASGVPLPVTALVQQLVQGCIGEGMGDDDMMVLLPRLRREAGLR